MKKAPLAALIFLLLLIPTFVNIPKVRATTTEDLWVTYALPEDVPREPMPENFTTEDYLNTTNPYSNLASAQGALDEVDDPEGSNPLYVLVFGDEEERELPLNWEAWAKLQLERGDEALVANFGIDIRILGFLEWDSNDSKDSMYDLWDELGADTEQHLGQWYDGEWWSNYVDAIIGITAQSTPADDPPVAGLASKPSLLDQGRIFDLLKWQGYWADDNLVQHEVSHLYYAPDHPEPQPPAPCCAMAYHRHSQSWIWEDGLWWVFADVPCAYTAYSWCTNCHQTIQQKSGRYVLQTLTISASSGGTTIPAPGTYTYNYSSSVTVTPSATSGYVFSCWLLDGGMYYQNPITVTMDADHTLTAYFSYSGGGGCPILYVYNGTEYICEGLLDIHNPEGVDVVFEHTLVSTPQRVHDAYLFRLVEHPQTHSYIDQVKLYAILEDKSMVELPLIRARHSEYGNVLPQLLFSDDWKTDTLGANLNNGTSQSIDLKFATLNPNMNIASFVFQIEGNNIIAKR